MERFDVIVVGGGIAGVSAALRAADLNGRVCLIERERIGGSYLKRGLYRQQRALHLAHSRSDSGGAKTSSNGWFARSSEGADQVSESWKQALLQQGVHLEPGSAEVADAGTVRVNQGETKVTLQTKSLILATGSSPTAPATIPFEENRILAPDEVYGLTDVPAQVLILGAGREGCELATLYNRLGSRTFLCDERPRLLPDCDPELGAVIEREMKSRKFKLLLGKKVVSIFKNGDAIDVSLDGGVKFSVDQIVIAGRRKARSECLPAGALGVRLGESGEVLVDETMASSAAGIYAVGSVTGQAHSVSAVEEAGRVAASNAMGKPRKFDADWMPEILFTDPQAASVGCFAAEAHHKGFRAVEGRCDYGDIDHARIHGNSGGFFKIAADKVSRKVIGAQVVAPQASEFMPLILLMIKKGMAVTALTGLSCSPTDQFRGIREAARDCVRVLKSKG